MNLLQRVIAYGFVIIIVVTSLWFLKPGRHVTAKGIFLPAKHLASFPKSNRIDVLTQLPENYKDLGIINVEMHFGKSHLTTMIVAAAEQKAEALAKKVGANAIYIKKSGYTRPGSTNAGLQVFVLKAEAIRYKQPFLSKRIGVPGLDIY